MRKALLVCGILASVVHAASNIIVPFYFDGYSSISQTVSELSAIGAPTRILWNVMMAPYTLLSIAFAVGVWMSSGKSRALRISAVCGLVSVVFGAFWPPMHLRGAEFTLTDTLHIAWTAVVVPLMMLQIAFGSAAFGRGFRIYSVLTIAAMIAFGVLTSLEAPNIATNGPTPLIGVWERIGIVAQMVWVPVFAVGLLRRSVAGVENSASM